MSILIRQARILSPGSTHNNKIVDILVDGGRITEIKKNITARGGPRIIEGEGLCVSPGWIDLQAVSCDPGYEHRETVDSMLKAAAAGGFTAVCVHSNNQPPLHTKSQIEYLLNRGNGRVTQLLPFGTVTVDGAGKDLAEMFDMKQSGAVAFSDYKHPIADGGTLLRALQYVSGLKAVVCAHCNDTTISRGGQMNEGDVAAQLGLKGAPALAEELMLERNLSILGYAGGRLHIPTISTKGSVDLVKKAKAAGLAVTCGVSAANLLLDDSVLREFDTNYKLDPPLRTRRDVVALRNAVENGTVDVIVSDHLPLDPENKDLEFDLAEPGMIGLQTAFSCALEGMGDKLLAEVVRCFATGPREVLGMPDLLLNEGEDADLTVFAPGGTTTLTERNNYSRSRNSPFFNKPLAGRVIGVIRGSRTFFNNG